MDPTSLRTSARRLIRRNCRRIARIVSEFEHDRQTTHQEPSLQNMSGDLTALATLFGTDKWCTHRYAQHYQQHLDRLLDRPINLLEIGVSGRKFSG